MDYAEAKLRSEILKALAHPVRVLIVEALAQGDRCVADLNRLVHLHQSNVSRHLAILKKAGIISEQRRGARVFHRLETPCIRMAFECAVKVIAADMQRRKKIVQKLAK